MVERKERAELIDLRKAVEIPKTNGKYLIFENEQGNYRVYSRRTNRVLKDCHGREIPREYNVRHAGIMKMLGIETIKKMCGI